MKKVIFCITNDIIYDRRIQRCAASLSKEYNVEIICRKLHKIPFENQNFAVTRMTCLFNNGFAFYCEYNLRLFFNLLRTSAKTIVAVDYDTIIPVRIAARLKNRQFVFDAHEYFEESIEIVNRPRIQKFWKWVGRKNVPQADLAYTVSESIAKEYNLLHGIEFYVIRNLPFYKKNILERKSKDSKIVIYQGVLNKGRQLELLIDSAEFLSDEFEIWILGEGDLSENLKKRSKGIRSNCKIQFFSWVEPNHLNDYTHKAFLAYNLLENKSKSYYYSLANKYFDYIQAGVPSINSEFPEYVILHQQYDCSYITNVNVAQELANLIVSITNDTEGYKSKKANAILAAEELCWENEEKKLIGLFNDLDD